MDRSIDNVITHSRLMSLPGHEVFSFLEKNFQNSNHSIELDDETEKDLLSRNDFLIDLGLAQFGFNSETFKSLFGKKYQNPVDHKAIRYALLNNRSKPRILENMPQMLFHSKEDCIEYFKSIPTDEIFTLFQNPNLSDSFLSSFFKGEHECWKVLNDEQRLAALEAIGDNARIETSYDDSQFMDGYSDYLYHSVFDALWNLSDWCPANRAWSVRLALVYDKLIPTSHSIKDPIKVSQRWFIDPTDSKAIERENEKNKGGSLSEFQGVRKGLAKLHLQGHPEMLVSMCNSKDIAFRSASYRFGKLNPALMQDGFKLEPELFIGEALFNENLWKNPETREVLETMAWTDLQGDGDLLWANVFNAREKMMREKHPRWFDSAPKGEDSEEVKRPTTVEDLNQIAVSITQVTLEKFNDVISPLAKKTQWIFWMSVGALAVSLLKH